MEIGSNLKDLLGGIVAATSGLIALWILFR